MAVERDNNNRILWIVFWGLVGLIMILIVGIIILINNSQIDYIDNENVAIEAEVAYDADHVISEIGYKLENDSSYTMEDAEQEFRTFFELADQEQKIYLTTFYANLVYDQTKDIEKAVSLLKEIEPEIGSESRAGFYMTFSDLYRSAGMIEEAEKYYNLAAELYEKNND